MEQQVERFAPGFRSHVVSRRVLTPPVLESLDANLVGGAINGGTTAPHQQAVLRPVPGTGRPETPVRGLYLASSSAHPGGGVHGACGANAARAALRTQRPLKRWLTESALTLSQQILTAPPGEVPSDPAEHQARSARRRRSDVHEMPGTEPRPTPRSITP